MQLKIRLKNDHCADGIYTLRAPGCILGALFWADERGPLADHTAFGILPLAASNGAGRLVLAGGRAVPPEATAVFVRAVYGDLQRTIGEQFPIPGRSPCRSTKRPLLRAVALSDLHLVRKTGILRRALRRCADADCLLLTGDLTNDGTAEAFDILQGCLDQEVPELPVFCVNGNHDLLRGTEPYFAFEEARALAWGSRGIPWDRGCDGIYTARLGQVEVIGLNAVKPWKELAPISKAQLQWLDEHLSASTAKWHILLCHTPLCAKVPLRTGRSASYLNREEHLQSVLDAHKGIVFLSGHTHLSPNLPSGTVHWDREKRNVSINCGSIHPTELGADGILAPGEWVDGNTVELTLTEDSLEIRMYALHENKWISRGHYAFDFYAYS